MHGNVPSRKIGADFPTNTYCPGSSWAGCDARSESAAAGADRTAEPAAVPAKPALVALAPLPDACTPASTACTRLLHVFSCAATAWKDSVKPHLCMHWYRVALAAIGTAVASAATAEGCCVDDATTNRCPPSLSLHPSQTVSTMQAAAASAALTSATASRSSDCRSSLAVHAPPQRSRTSQV